ncbi:MAG: hypothetical protein COX65_06965 [Elusimicrobia bacterium CG_4_10_14_0_2_um_filter_56_8]|nr:MAG: hypothetical protein COX65_06965 [Elusimicrobia bacterium CG_4_10_14_0_2_um_filter_56_8]
MIKRLELPDFGKFRKAGLELGPFTVITGPNEAGKTTVFDALFDTLCAESRHEGRPLWKNMASRYTALRKAELVWEEGFPPLSFGDNEFIEIFAIRGGQLGVNHPENKGASAWALAAENTLLNAGLNPEALALELADKAGTTRKGSVQAKIKRLRETIKDHEQAIAGLKAERETVLAGAQQGPRLEAEKKEKESALAAKNAELKSKKAALEKLAASIRRAAVMAGLTALRELKEAREAMAALAAFAKDETPKYRALQAAHQEAERNLAAAEATVGEKQATVAAATTAIEQLEERARLQKPQSECAAGLAIKLGTYASAPGKIFKTVNKGLRYGVWAAGALLAAYAAYSGHNTVAYAAAAGILGAAVLAGIKFSVTEKPGIHTAEEIKSFLTLMAADWAGVSQEPFPAEDLEAGRAFLAKVQAEYAASVRASGDKAAELGALAVVVKTAVLNRDGLRRAAEEAQKAGLAWFVPYGCTNESDYQGKVSEYKKLSARAADREQRVLALAGGNSCKTEDEFKDKMFAENGDLERRGVVPASGMEAEFGQLQKEAETLDGQARDIEAALNKVKADLQTNLAVSGARLGGLPERLNQVETVLEADKEELADLELQADAYLIASGVFRKLAETSAMAFETLGKEVTETLRAIIPEVHAEFRGFEAEGAAVTDAGGITRPVKSLSTGMRDLFMLAARLTIARRARLGPEGLAPALLVLDEPFYTLDGERERLALKLLANFHRSTGWQIIFLTKDPKLAGAASIAEGLPVTKIELKIR